MDTVYFASGAAILLLFFLLYQEWTRPNPARLIWRLLASAIAVISLILFVVPIRYYTNIKTRANEINLLTEGFPVDSLTQLKGKTYALNGVNTQRIKQIQEITSLHYFLNSHKDVQKIQLYGFGLSKEELQLLNGYDVNFHPSAAPSGVVACNWPRTIGTTEALTVQGTYRNTSPKTIQLILEGSGIRMDSIRIDANSRTKFSFKAYPKQNGKAVYQLLEMQAKDTLNRESIPFEVLQQSAVKVLILASFPDFEYKFLKTWLYENQYPLAIRSQISKNKFSTDFLNLPAFNLAQISEATLKKFDVLIVDETELAALNPAEQSTIAHAVENGLGLLIRSMEPKASTRLSAGFNRYEGPKLKDKSIHLRSFQMGKLFGKLPAEEMLYLKTAQNDQPIATNLEGKVVVNSQLHAQGKIVLSTLPATYYWLLDGNKSDYTSFWSELLSRTSRKIQPQQTFSFAPGFPKVHQKIRWIVEQQDAEKAPELYVNGARPGVRQNMELPFIWDAFAWPQQEGWTTWGLNQGKGSVYIYPKNSWMALTAGQHLQDTKNHTASRKKQQGKTKELDQQTEKEVGKGWFFISFLLAGAFLWYEARILNKK